MPTKKARGVHTWLSQNLQEVSAAINFWDILGKVPFNAFLPQVKQYITLMSSMELHAYSDIKTGLWVECWIYQ